MITYEPFWETLKKTGISTYALIHKYHISSSTISRLRHNKPITTVTLNDLCNILECTINDIARYQQENEIDLGM